GRADETETAETIRATFEASGDLIDPHTAVALAVSQRDNPDADVLDIVMSTSHAAKFPDAVEAASHHHPGLPAYLDGLMTRPEQITVMANDQAAVERLVMSVSRAVHQGVLS